MERVAPVAPAVDGADQLAIDELYAVHHPSAVRLAFLLCGNEQEAQDIAQDAFVRLLSRPVSLRNPEAFPLYLRRTVTTTCFSRRRSAARERARLERTALPAQAPSSPEHDDALWEALHHLPERQRAALVLRFWMDLSEADIAATLRCRPGTVKSSIARGLETLRTEVTRDVD